MTVLLQSSCRHKVSWEQLRVWSNCVERGLRSPVSPFLISRPMEVGKELATARAIWGRGDFLAYIHAFLPFSMAENEWVSQGQLLPLGTGTGGECLQDNEQKFSINLMHVRFSKDELCVAKSLLSSPVYGWLNKQRDNLSLRVSAGERREQQANLMWNDLDSK